MPIPHQEPEFRSHFLRRSNNVALVVYPLRKSIKWLLNAGPFAAAGVEPMPAHSSSEKGESHISKPVFQGA
jgi:hypothetical protein